MGLIFNRHVVREVITWTAIGAYFSSNQADDHRGVWAALRFDSVDIRVYCGNLNKCITLRKERLMGVASLGISEGACS